MTLSRFLRDYLYIPLGGNRAGKVKRYLNLFLTMLLGGLWHGAGWTFVFWGCLHGIYLIINHGWHALIGSLNLSVPNYFCTISKAFSVILTFLSVCLAWVVFRSDTIQSALTLLETMLGLDGFCLPKPWLEHKYGTWLIQLGVQASNTTPFVKIAQIIWLTISAITIWALPNTQQLMSNYAPALNCDVIKNQSRFIWKPTPTWLAICVLFATASILSLAELSEFIYFQF